MPSGKASWLSHVPAGDPGATYPCANRMTSPLKQLVGSGMTTTYCAGPLAPFAGP